MIAGIDMTPEQLAVATTHMDAYTRNVLGYAQPNMRFINGQIEKLPEVDDASQDLIISNCVVRAGRHLLKQAVPCTSSCAMHAAGAHCLSFANCSSPDTNAMAPVHASMWQMHTPCCTLCCRHTDGKHARSHTGELVA